MVTLMDFKLQEYRTCSLRIWAQTSLFRVCSLLSSSVVCVLLCYSVCNSCVCVPCLSPAHVQMKLLVISEDHLITVLWEVLPLI